MEIKLGPPLKFYDGSITLRFCEERDGKKCHEYLLDHGEGAFTPVVGVTTATGILDKSFYLMPWACKAMEQKILRTVPFYAHPSHLAGTTLPISMEDFSEIIRKAKRAHKEILLDAGDVGTAAHTWIEDSIIYALKFNEGYVNELVETSRPVDDRAISCGMAALSWMQSHNVKWLKTERKVYSNEYNYAGTMDGLALVSSCCNFKCCSHMFFEELSLIDWKSSNHLRTDYLYQTAAYEHAEEEEFGVDIKSRWILRLGKDDGKFQPWYATCFDEDFTAFLACLNLLRANRRVEDRMAAVKKKHAD